MLVEENELIKVLSYSSAGFSIGGCIFIIFSYIYFPKLRMFPFKLIVLLSVTELLVSVCVFFTSPMCWIGGAVTNYFELCSMMWISIIAYNIRQILCFNNRNAHRYERYYHMIAWGIPAILCIPVAVAGQFGKAGIWCWIKESALVYRWTCYYGPWALILAFNLAVYVSVASALSSSAANASDIATLSQSHVSSLASQPQLLSNRQEYQVMLRLRLYLLVFFWVSFWSFGNRINEILHPNKLTTFTIMHAFFRPLMGFMNSIVYGVNRRLVSEYRSIFASCLPASSSSSPPDSYHLHEAAST